uniref:Uncharacterized protein n=1 Tax=Cacopsylla melanoneura TaxID=428564 RepID=A0A8D8V5C4_9HEMI
MRPVMKNMLKRNLCYHQMRKMMEIQQQLPSMLSTSNQWGEVLRVTLTDTSFSFTKKPPPSLRNVKSAPIKRWNRLIRKTLNIIWTSTFYPNWTFQRDPNGIST